MKLYVIEKRKVTSDGDVLTTVEVYESRPRYYTYLLWV